MITTNYGSYLEVEFASDITLDYNILYDSDGTLTTSFICATKCGNECDYFDATGIHQKLVGTIAGTTAARTLTVAKDQVVDNTIYLFTLRVGYEKVLSTKMIQVKVLDKDATKLEGQWKVTGVNSQ